MNPKVSVCVPVFNGELYIAELIESLIAQSFSDIEIIISDNASIDKTPEIIKSYAAKDARIQYFRNAENIGYSRNIAAAVLKARCEYIAIYHSDDVYHPQIIEKELSLLESDSSIGGVFTYPAIFYNNIKKAERKNYYKIFSKMGLFQREFNAFVGRYEDYFPLLLEYGNIFACPSFMTRKKIFLKIGGFTDLYPSNEDFELWIKYLKCGWKLGVINDYLLYYRMSNNHASAYWRRRPEIAVMYKVIDEMLISKNKLSQYERTLYAKNKAIGYARSAVNAAAIKNYSKAHAFSLISRNEFSLSPFSFWGFAQKFPKLAFFLKKFIDYLNQYVFR